MKISQIEKNGKTQYRVAWRANGKELRRFFTTKGDADAHAAEVAGELKTHGEAGSGFSELSAVDRADLLAAFEEAKKGGFRLIEAVSAFTSSRATIRSTITVEAFVAECIVLKRNQGLAPKSLVCMSSNWNIFAKTFGPRDLSSIRPLEIEGWLSKNGWAPSTKRSKRTDIQTLFSHAEKLKYVSENPCHAVPVPIEDDKPPGILTVKECAALMAAAKESDKGLLGYLVPALFCGIRPGELARIPREAVELDRKFIRIDFSKNRQERRLVTLEPNAIEWLRPGTWQLPPPALRDRLERLRLRVGLFEEWPNDALRHSFGSYHYAKYDNAALTAKEMGNTPDILFKHYRELVTKADAEAFFQIVP